MPGGLYSQGMRFITASSPIHCCGNLCEENKLLNPKKSLFILLQWADQRPYRGLKGELGSRNSNSCRGVWTSLHALDFSLSFTLRWDRELGIRLRYLDACGMHEESPAGMWGGLHLHPRNSTGFGDMAMERCLCGQVSFSLLTIIIILLTSWLLIACGSYCLWKRLSEIRSSVGRWYPLGWRACTD